MISETGRDRIMNQSAKMKPRVHSIASDGLELPVCVRIIDILNFIKVLLIYGAYNLKIKILENRANLN